MMAKRGVGIYPWEEVPPTEVPFYKWDSQEGLLKSITEADRGLLAGAMEYVPAHRLAEVLKSSTISPWTIADQGGGKWRLCHDYSVGTNRVVPSAAFTLPSVWDARACIRPDSHFAKYDIRDGFWHVPIADDSKKRLVVRHPGTGRLMWASRLPFGYIESPRLFCALTEAVIARLRKQAAGRGIHFYVFVDDVLVIGDDEGLTREGMSMLEAEFAARGLQWAPHKKRGPCRCIEFLGLLMCNVEGLRGITITKKRRAKLIAEMEMWMAREPEEGELKADPRELASFLGKLVFVSQVVAGGRTYMQGMLTQFKGLLVDWQRGQAGCREGADVETKAQACAEVEVATAPKVFFGVYSDAVGISGVFVDPREVESATSDDSVYSSSCSFATQEEAARFIRQTTLERASEVVASGPAVKGSLVKRAHLFEKLSDARLAMIDLCIAGKCGVDHDETSTACLSGCGRRLHVETCAQMGRGFAALGNFRCVDCRLKELVVPGSIASPSAEIERVVRRTMVLELNQGKETTAAGFADYTQLEERYALGMGRVLDGAALHLPRHNAESFKNFLTWMAIDADRARSVESVMRTAGSMMVKLGLPDVTKDGSVKAHAKDLLDGISMEHETATTATPAMLKWCLEKGIDERFKHPSGFVALREKVQFICEGVGGCRIGEVCGGGESHGILANNLRFIEDPMGTDAITKSIVEFKLEHSKTGYSRYLDMAAVTATSELPVAATIMAYCKAAGFKMLTSVQAGVRVITPDFWVARVSLLGLNEQGMNRLLNVLSKDKSISVFRHLETTKTEARRRYAASGSESQTKKYINVASGDSTDASLDEVVARLCALGYTAQKLPGPLLLATTGGNRQVPKLMPYSTSTASAPTKEILTKAWQAGCVGGVSQDPDLDLAPGAMPKWSTHSLRRLGDTVARRYRHVTGVTADQIDIYFGWQEKILLLAMQVHYASLSIRERMSTAKITGMM
ncbi:reverse transcriptase family protein [Chrysochromulina tobinii]|uniref:Reverse transcriptase family protein n=1 Tax=Chrysochromulina tobinii TaxID=1460289 RepID=A0A0M0JVJ2_9EUKA|nr:reverse transcriptase family protein [Chrysochromulina tobinii]|eukprot:KOO30544.1 reverse transcriptase family protein [Chrysochromulina sp. CCMP291]